MKDMSIKITGADRGLLLLYDTHDQLNVKLAKDLDYGNLRREEREVSDRVRDRTLDTITGFAGHCPIGLRVVHHVQVARVVDERSVIIRAT